MSTTNVWPNAVITQQGIALEEKQLSGVALEFTRAVSGSGTVSVADLASQTAVTSPEQTLTFRTVSYPIEGTAAVPVYLTNSNLTTGYTATQIGLYAQDPDEGEILYFIAQAASGQGTEIPSNTEMPGFSAEWTFSFSYSQSSNISITVDPANTVSASQAQTMIDQAIENAELSATQITEGTLPVERGGTGVSELSSAPTSGSIAPITSGAVYEAINAINASQINAGTLPVARGGTGQTSVDTTPTSGSSKMVTSGGVYTALHAINTSQITAGTLPVARGGTGVTALATSVTSGNSAPVTSGAVYTAVNARQTKITYGTGNPSGGTTGDVYIRYSS